MFTRERTTLIVLLGTYNERVRNEKGLYEISMDDYLSQTV